jgi:hypothetical protein
VVLGRSAGLSDEEMGHLMDDPLPEGMFPPAEQAIIRFARASALMEPITDDLWDDLRRHFSIQAIIEIGFIVGMHQLTTRFHSLVLTDLDTATSEQLTGGSCRVRLPRPPAAATST